MKKAVAYIDLLGFTDCVQNNPDEAIMMLTQFNSVLSSLNFERVAHPSSGYLHGLQDLARRNSNESFEHFLPFSDSVFIVSSDCSNFLMQLGNFVKDSFLLNARVYSNPENPSNPTETHYIGFDSSNPNCNKPVSIPCSQPPVLFRGGLSYGEVIETSPTALFKNHIFTCNNLMGEAVIRAVRMERVVKGPRIIFDQEMYSQLNEDVKLYCRSIPDKIKDNGTAGLYEILWPALGFILENKTSFYQEITHFYDLFNPAYNLWRYYKNSEVANHYERFLELIVYSSVRIYSHMGCRDFILQEMKKAFAGKFSNKEIAVIFGGVFD